MPYDSESSAIARMYDGDHAAHRTPSGDVDFYVEEARNSGGPVAEFGCGTGRILVPTAQAGIEIVGVDLSQTMLDQLRAKNDQIELHAGDMRDFEIGRTFKLVTIPFRALSHIEASDDHVQVFANMRRHMEPEGRLVFDVFNPSYKHLADTRPEQLGIEREEDGKQIRRYFNAAPHHDTQVIDVEMRWEIEDDEGNIEELREAFTMRWFFRYELEHALARAGLAVETIYGDFDRSPLRADSPDYIFIARHA